MFVRVLEKIEIVTLSRNTFKSLTTSITYLTTVWEMSVKSKKAILR